MKSFLVKVEWLHGKCLKTPPVGRYITSANFDENTLDQSLPTWSVILERFKRDRSGGFDEATASFLFPNAPQEWVKVGTEFTMMEGARPTAVVTVLKV